MKIELEWRYQPTDFFESEFAMTLSEGQLRFESGKAALALQTPADPLTSELRSRLTEYVDLALSARRLQNRRMYTLSGPHVTQHGKDGGRNVVVSAGAAVAVANVGQVDWIATDASGRVTHDTRQYRIEDEGATVRELALKACRSETLRSMLDSYGRSVSDPANELVHLYELRDAVSEHFGDEGAARDALAISKREWQELGRLANGDPIAEGRHRGRQLGNLRPATADELTTARTIGRSILAKFASTL